MHDFKLEYDFTDHITEKTTREHNLICAIIPTIIKSHLHAIGIITVVDQLRCKISKRCVFAIVFTSESDMQKHIDISGSEFINRVCCVAADICTHHDNARQCVETECK